MLELYPWVVWDNCAYADSSAEFLVHAVASCNWLFPNTVNMQARQGTGVGTAKSK